MELNKPPVVTNVLVMTDLFTRYALAVVTKDQTAKTVMKVFYECFIAVFGAPAKLLSDRGANFTSTLVEELCSAFSVSRSEGPQLTMLSVTGRWSISIRHYFT